MFVVRSGSGYTAMMPFIRFTLVSAMRRYGDAAVHGTSTSPFFYLVFTIVFCIVFEMSLAHLCNILLIGTLTLLYFSG